MTQFLVATLSNAAIYALVAVALNVVYRSSGILNFGAGHIAAVAGIFYANELPANPVGILIAVSGAAILSLVAYFTTVWWGRRKGFDLVALSLALLGFGMILDYIAGLVWEHGGFSPAALVDGSVTVAGTTFATERFVVVIMSAVFIIGILMFVDKTMTGSALQATAADSELATLYGVRAGLVTCVAWALAGAALGLAGVLQGSISAVSLSSAIPLLVIGLATAVAGGLGSIRNVLLGAVVIAGAQAGFVQFVSTQFSASVVFLLLFVTLAVRPSGLFVSTRNAERV